MIHVALVLVFSCFFFFFQAEDGIRDLTVTGVQTCALPIFAFLLLTRTGVAQTRAAKSVESGTAALRALTITPARIVLNGRYAECRPLVSGMRSEERRVGKECRCGLWEVA